MANPSRRTFLAAASAVALTVASRRSLAAASQQRIFVGTCTPDGILAFNWNSATGDLTPAGVAAKINTVDWVTFSAAHNFLFAAAEVDTFNGKPTGEVASFSVRNGELQPLSAENSAAAGTCHVALDHTGRVLLSADYGGGSAASFKVTNGRLSPVVWTEHYTQHGPNTDRQQSAHAHFASFSPDNRFAYINDLGGDCIHIYKLNAATAMLTPAGTYHAQPGAGCRTLHFHPNEHTAYCVNELNSTVDVLDWKKEDGSLTRATTIELLPEGYHGPTRCCDTVITRSGRFVYFANRDNDFLYSFRADPQTGALTPMKRSNCGGKIPRNFTLDPTEHWMLVANQDSNNITVFARNPQTGVLAESGKTITVQAPMCILFS
jgi:6-phosphogluconolactonase